MSDFSGLEARVLIHDEISRIHTSKHEAFIRACEATGGNAMSPKTAARLSQDELEATITKMQRYARSDDPKKATWKRLNAAFVKQLLKC
jgi:hypothetical protein